MVDVVIYAFVTLFQNKAKIYAVKEKSMKMSCDSWRSNMALFRTRRRTTWMKRIALKCSARPCSLYIIQLTRDQTFRASISGQDPEIRRQEGEHWNVQQIYAVSAFYSQLDNRHFCGFRTRSRNTPIGRRALICSARPCSLYIIHPTWQQTFFVVSGQDQEIRRQKGEHWNVQQRQSVYARHHSPLCHELSKRHSGTGVR